MLSKLNFAVETERTSKVRLHVGRLTLLLEEGKKILGVWRWSPRYCSAVMEGFVVGAAPVSCTMLRLKQDKRDNEQR